MWATDKGIAQLHYRVLYSGYAHEIIILCQSPNILLS